MDFNHQSPRNKMNVMIKNDMQNINNMNNMIIMNNMNFMNNMQNMNNINNMNTMNNINYMNTMNNMNNMNINNNMNYMKIMNNQNNFFAQNITNQIQNLNFCCNNNGNMEIKQNQREEEKKITFINICFRVSSPEGNSIWIQIFPEEKVSKLIEKYRKKSCDFSQKRKFIFDAKNLNVNMTCAEAGLLEGANIFVVNIARVSGGEGWYIKEINIKFINISKNDINKNNNKDIIGLLKLCLLKEISPKISEDKLKVLPELIYYILKILSNGYIEDKPNDAKKNITEVLEKTKGSNIITFSNYVDEIIDSQLMKKILNLLNKKDLNEMIHLKNRLSNYNNCIKFFNKEFIQAQKESILEFSIISLVIIGREDFEKFEREREKCPNRVERIVFHGTSIEPASSILTGLYRKSLEKKKAINGKGIYFTNLLDYAWYYGSEEGNRANFSGIPKINDTFTVIMNYIYYDRSGAKQVYDSKRTPGKNQINYALAGARSERISNFDKNKFYATEYVIYDLDQICPFMSAKLKRVEYCVIWRDDNFSSKPVYNNKFDEIFKSFLKERLKYINQNAKYNIYPCKTTEEALELVKRKKYNKIILISNVGKNFGGKTFIDEARKILGNNVITLFLAYKNSHLDWIKKYENALFSNDPKIYEEYLECFDIDKKFGEEKIKENIQNLIVKLESHYKVKFNFNEKYLDYPLFLEEGKYIDLKF